ncbi:hypothetical protein IMZ48_46040 [Candidatus Bathyarchaeota archaeon]|nr:hypothetical protein [Candidatus Bathyarchaeota archaeon]
MGTSRFSNEIESRLEVEGSLLQSTGSSTNLANHGLSERILEHLPASAFAAGRLSNPEPSAVNDWQLLDLSLISHRVGYLLDNVRLDALRRPR